MFLKVKQIDQNIRRCGGEDFPNYFMEVRDAFGSLTIIDLEWSVRRCEERLRAHAGCRPCARFAPGSGRSRYWLTHMDWQTERWAGGDPSISAQVEGLHDGR
jgi:hypothetical protein